MSDAIQPFPIHIPQADLDDLADRLARTRWPDAGTVQDGSQGPQSDRIRALAQRWQDDYDWRATEKLLNGWCSSRTVIDGLGIHFLHVRSPEPDATPLLLTHGWPGSVLEFRDVIGPLSDPRAHGGDASDAFHLVIPALPGFGFSDKPTEPGWGVGRTAAAWGELMQRLGYGDRWMAQGGDWGAAVTTALAHMRMPGLAGIHLNMVMVQPTPGERQNATPAEQQMLDDAAVSYRIVMTKADKVKVTELTAVVARTAEEIKKRPAAHPDIIATSSEGGLGIAELRAAVLEAVIG